MGLLSHNRLKVLVDQGVITNVHPDQINSASIDITLGKHLLVERRHPEVRHRVISLKNRDKMYCGPHNLDEGPYRMHPGEFLLAQSEQVFFLPPTISAEYKLKSSMARIGLEHLNAGWCDAGWNGSVLTLELKNMTNHHYLELEAGVGIGQIVFYEHEPVPADRSYAARGRYNNDKMVHGIKE